jgi:hypothetical protein
MVASSQTRTFSLSMFFLVCYWYEIRGQ